MVEVQATASARAPWCCPSLGLAKGLGSSLRAAVKPSGWLDRKCLQTA